MVYDIYNDTKAIGIPKDRIPMLITRINMLPVYICEDNEIQLLYFEKIIKNTATIEALDADCVCAVSSPTQLLSYLREHPTPSLYFLDIELNSTMDGFALAQEIRKIDPRGFIVFITGHSELSPMTFLYRIEAMDYILKNNPAEIAARIRECLLHAVELYTTPTNTIQQAIALKIDGRILSFKLPEIYSIETSNEAHKIRIYDATGYSELFYSLKQIKDLLNEDFFQCHKSCIINMNHIQEIDKKNYTVTLENGRICPVSTRLMHELAACWLNENESLSCLPQISP